MNISASRTSLQLLLGVPGIQIQIPAFQRPYAWEDEQVDELWQDVTSTLSTGHFMGSLVLSGADPQTRTVIDGQQRLTTILLLLAQIRDRYRALGSDLSGRVQQFLTNAFDQGDRHFKLRTGDANWTVFRDFVLRAPDDPARKRWEQLPALDKGLVGRNQRLISNRKRLQDHLDTWLARPGARAAAVELETLEQFLVTKLEFVVIVVPEVADAFVIFETLNDRGLALSAGDLLKNHLLHKAAEARSDVEVLSDEWEEMLESLQQADITRFLRHYLLIQHPRVLKEDVFDFFKKELSGTTPAALMDELQQMARHYGEFVAVETVDPGDTKDVLTDLDTLRATLCYSTLLAARRFPENLKERDFIRLARICETLTFRYSTICSKDSKELEKAYHRAAKRLWDSKGTDLAGTLAELEQYVPSSDEFCRAFQTQSMGKQYVVNYVLRKLEEQLDSEEKTTRQAGPVHIEHIMPQTLCDEWRQALGDRLNEHSTYVNRWGNLTLLGGRKNIRASNKPFAAKRDVYAQSSILLTRNLSKKSAWGLDDIEERQLELGKLADRVWNVT